MANKVTLAIFDNTLKATVNKYEVSKDGTKIVVVSGGEGHFMPSFNNDSFIEFPKKKWEIWKPQWTRIYFVSKKGKKCVDFSTTPPTVSSPDPEQLKIAVGSTMLGQIGKDKQETPLVIWLILAGVVFSILFQMGVFN